MWICAAAMTSHSQPTEPANRRLRTNGQIEVFYPVRKLIAYCTYPDVVNDYKRRYIVKFRLFQY